jgi:hypothetical protein
MDALLDEPTAGLDRQATTIARNQPQLNRRNVCIPFPATEEQNDKRRSD